MKRQRARPSHSGRRARRLALVLLAVTAVGVIAIGLALQLNSRPWRSTHAAARRVEAMGVDSGPAPVTPPPRAFDAYAGSESCRGCHAEEFEAWGGSNHGLAERALDPLLDGPAFASVRRFTHGTQSTEVSGPGTVTTTGPSGAAESFGVARVIGHSPLRQFLVPFPGGRWQTLEASYDPSRDEWFNVYGDEDRKPGEWGHWTGRGMTWNTMCASCHNVRVRKGYDPASDSFATTLAERSVGCEACHGPMREHVRWRAANRAAAVPEPGRARLSGEQVFQTCGSCHARRSDLTGEFVPGDAFDDHFDLALVDASATYYPDGQVREENYEYGAFLGSRMHAAGVRCIDCHEPHSAKVRLPGNLMCMSCHGGKEGVPVIDPASHGFHRLDPLYSALGGGPDAAGLAARDRARIAASGGECVNCHMPQTVYMQRHRRHDHGFTIPDPLLTQELGIPNACNRCHADRDAGWAASAVEGWYGEKMNRPSRDRARLIAAARAGEPSARARLLAFLDSGPADYWRASAIALLSRWAGEPAVDAALVRALHDPAPMARAQALESLRPVAASPAIAPTIMDALRDPARSVRFHAARALPARLDERSPGGREFLDILEYIADQPAGRVERGAYAMARARPTQALEEYQVALGWDPHSPPILDNLAVVLATLGRPAEALAHLREAVRLAPGDAELRYRLALVCHEAGRTSDAIEAFREAVALDPGHARAWYNLGLALDAAGRTADSLEALSRAEAASPADPRVPYAAATILARLGRVDDAKSAAHRALAASPTFVPARELLNSLAKRPGSK